MSAPPHSRAQTRAAEENKDLVTRVKEWLTPASWLSYWEPADHTHPPPTTASTASSSSDPLSLWSSAPGLPAVPVSDSSVPSGSEASVPGPSRRLFQGRAESRGTGGGSSRSDPHVGMELESDVVGSGPMGKGPDDSDESWVAEDTGMDELEPDSRQYRHRDRPLGTEAPPRKSARTSSPESHALLPRDPLAEGVESRQQAPAYLFQRSPYPFGPGSLVSRLGPPGAVGFSSRLFTAGPLTTSTPQLSPVQEETDAGVAASSTHQHLEGSSPNPHPPSHPPSHPHPHPPSPSFSTAPFTTPLRLHTELSLSRSPFQSPFYSGRTSFGGAASSQKLRGKRPRTESSPPTFAPLRYSVTARPAPSDGYGPSASQTARKILATLSSLSSPLADARRLPMRRGPLPEEGQQPAKRRRAEGSAPPSVLSPPPTTPLVTPTQASQSKMHAPPVLVPNEKTLLLRGGEGGGASTSQRPAASKSPHTTQVLQFGIQSASPTHSTALGPTHSTALGSAHSTPFSGLTFTAPLLRQSPGTTPPLAVTPPTQQRSPESHKTISPVAGFKPTFHAAQLANVGGKVRGKRSSAHYSMQREHEPEEYVNPSPLPPPVGLSLGKGAATPSFSFASEIKVTPSASQPTTVSKPTGSTSLFNPTKVSMATGSTVLSVGSKTGFSFAAPKSLGSQPGTASVSSQSTSYSFSAPKNCSTKPVVSTLQPYTKLLPPKAPPTQAVKQPPLLKNMSVVDALRQPEFQPAPLASSKNSNVIDLTSDEETTPPQTTPPPLPPLPPLSQFAPVSGSWSCETCCVSNKPSDSKCVCCGAAKPGSKSESSKLSSGGLQLGKSGVLQLGSSGGIKLGGGAGLKLVTSSGMQLGRGGISTGIKLPSGSAGLLVRNSAGLKLPTTGDVKIATSSAAGSKSDSTPQSAASGKPEVSNTTPLKLLPQFAPPAGSWSCDTCMLSNKPESDKCVACSEPKPGSRAAAAAPAAKATLGPSGGITLGGLKPLPQFAPPAGSWSCDSCMLSNKPEASKCAACGATRTGVEGSREEGNEGVKRSGGVVGFQLGQAGGMKLSLPGGVAVNTIGSGGIKLGGLPIGSGEKSSSVAVAGGGVPLGGGIKLALPDKTAECTKSEGPSGGVRLSEGPSGGVRLSEGPSGGVWLSEGPSGRLRLSEGPSGGLRLVTGATDPGAGGRGTQLLHGSQNPGASESTQLGTSSAGVVLGGSLSATAVTQSSQFSLKLPAQSTSQNTTASFPTLSRSTATANPLAGLKFGAAGTSSQLPTAIAAPQLQFAAPLSLGKSTAPSQPLASFTFSAATTGSSQKTEPSDGKKPSPIFPASTAASQLKTDSNLPSFVFSAAKSGADSASNSPFPAAGSVSAGGGLFGAKTSSSGLTGLQLPSSTAAGSQQPVALGRPPLPVPGLSQPAAFSQPGGLFGSAQQQPLTQANFQFHAAGAPAPDPSNPAPSLGFGAQTQSALTTPKLSFGSPSPALNFSGGGMGGANQLGAPKLQFGGSQSTFSDGNSGLGLGPGGAPAAGSGLGLGPGGPPAASSGTGFNFSGSSGINFNFGAGGGGGNTALFTAGSSSSSTSSNTSGRVIRKARRRKP